MKPSQNEKVEGGGFIKSAITILRHKIKTHNDADLEVKKKLAIRMRQPAPIPVPEDKDNIEQMEMALLNVKLKKL